MGIFLGIDIGSVSVKITVLGDRISASFQEALVHFPHLLFPAPNHETIQDEPGTWIFLSHPRRVRGNPLSTTRQLLQQVFQVIPENSISGARVCGSGSRLLSKVLGIHYENEFRAIARGVAAIYPGITTVFEIGGQNAKYIALEEGETGGIGIKDYEKSGDCAAGTGMFLDQQAARLKFAVTDIGAIVSRTRRSAKIAGRCSVFAKTDMIHAQQKGFSPSEVLRGLCEAVARNFKSSVMKGKRVQPPVLFIGGVAINSGVANAIREVFHLSQEQLIVPRLYAWLPAIGTALAERASEHKSPLRIPRVQKKRGMIPSDPFPKAPPLSMEKVVLLRDRVRPRILHESSARVETYLGIDVGSVSTNLALLDGSGNMIKEIYTRTEGRPIEVVARCLKQIEQEVGDRIRIRGVGTTGSGRELIGELIGADTINDEITAHKTGAEFLAQTMLSLRPDTIFEIGGQDAKYIRIENGIVVDFAMNEACAAGTGSFLEERAEELGIAIDREFAALALSSSSPIRLGERCTVFMQQDVTAYQQRGARKEDLCAGLAYSIVTNYLNRVVGNRKIGQVIFFQGGTAYNDAIASAFANVLERQIIVPPYNGVVGAVGAALLAKEKIFRTKEKTKFRGYHLDQVEYTLREFTCKACSNYCHMQEFTVEGEKTFWGDQCSDKFRRRQSARNKPMIEDLLSLRREWLFENYQPDIQGKATIGLPRGLYIYDQFPFWNAFLRTLGYRVVLSEESNAKIIGCGVETSVAEPCLPIQAYHGHVSNLIETDVDWILIPNMINAETPFPRVNSYYCPWGQTIPFVIRHTPEFSPVASSLISPTLRFQEGKEEIVMALLRAFKILGEKKKDIAAAVEKAYQAQKKFKSRLLEAGKSALARLNTRGEIGIVLVGRTYNVNDRGLTLDIGGKLRDYYGINVFPMDVLSVDEIDISDINPNMYWNYGRKILAAAKLIRRYPNLHLIYFTNFKCGPDSYIKHYVTKASGKPFLSLQFDGHGNDAGYLTRCEAYLDSKGALRWWAPKRGSGEPPELIEDQNLVPAFWEGVR